MKITITAKEFGETEFDNVVRSLWDDNQNFGEPIEVADQIRKLKEKFNITVFGGHFDNATKELMDHPYITDNEWNTKDAIIEFESEEEFVLFKLQWS